MPGVTLVRIGSAQRAGYRKPPMMTAANSRLTLPK